MPFCTWTLAEDMMCFHEDAARVGILNACGPAEALGYSRRGRPMCMNRIVSPSLTLCVARCRNGGGLYPVVLIATRSWGGHLHVLTLHAPVRTQNARPAS